MKGMLSLWTLLIAAVILLIVVAMTPLVHYGRNALAYSNIFILGFAIIRTMIATLPTVALVADLRSGEWRTSWPQQPSYRDAYWALKRIAWKYAILPVAILTLLEVSLLYYSMGDQSHLMRGIFYHEGTTFLTLIYGGTALILAQSFALSSLALFGASLTRSYNGGFRAASLVGIIPVLAMLMFYLSQANPSITGMVGWSFLLLPEYIIGFAQDFSIDKIWTSFAIFFVLGFIIWLILKLFASARLRTSPQIIAQPPSDMPLIGPSVAESHPGAIESAVAGSLRLGKVETGGPTRTREGLFAAWNLKIIKRLLVSPIAILLIIGVCLIVVRLVNSPYGLPIGVMFGFGPSSIVVISILLRVYVTTLPAMFLLSEIRSGQWDKSSMSRPNPDDAVWAMKRLAWRYAVIPSVILGVVTTALENEMSMGLSIIGPSGSYGMDPSIVIYIELIAFMIPLAFLMVALAYLGGIISRNRLAVVAGSILAAIAPAVFVIPQFFQRFNSPMSRLLSWTGGAIPDFGEISVGGPPLAFLIPVGLFAILAIAAWVFLGNRVRKILTLDMPETR
jgi:hypothetical protein